ncbi:MAG TPA: hypothetical protein VIK78_03630 [Ruminiclostridium sp.]
MKLRITRKELEDLTFEQKQNLCDLWIPHAFDVAVATVCVDAAEEKFDQITYVIGGIKLLRHHDMLLTDLKFMPDEQLKVQEEESYSSNIASDRIDGIEDLVEIEEVEETDEETLPDFTFDEDFNFEFQRPESYSKQDCVPLLEIGQMIDILERKNFGQGDFHISANLGDFSFDMGKNDFSSDNNFDENSQNCELCDILWESVKALL